MANLPVMNADSYLDSDNPRFNDAVTILHWLRKNQDQGKYSYLQISRDLQIPPTTVREFLVPEVMVFRSYDYLLKLRERNNRAYMYYMSNSDNANVEHRGKHGCRINISKFHYLRFVASLYSCSLEYVPDKNKYIVKEQTENESLLLNMPDLIDIDSEWNAIENQ